MYSILQNKSVRLGLRLLIQSYIATGPVSFSPWDDREGVVGKTLPKAIIKNNLPCCSTYCPVYLEILYTLIHDPKCNGKIIS